MTEQIEKLYETVIRGPSWSAAHTSTHFVAKMKVKALSASSYAIEPVGTDEAPAYSLSIWRHGPVSLDVLA